MPPLEIGLFIIVLLVLSRRFWTVSRRETTGMRDLFQVLTALTLLAVAVDVLYLAAQLMKGSGQ